MARTKKLSVYVAEAKKLLADRKAEISAQKAEEQRMIEAIANDEADMAAALKGNDQERYQRAAFAKQYHAGRLDLVKDNHSDVLPTDAEYEAQVKAMRAEYLDERIVLIDSLIEQVTSTMAQLDEITNAHNDYLATLGVLGGVYLAMQRNYIIRNDAESDKDEIVDMLRNMNLN